MSELKTAKEQPASKESTTDDGDDDLITATACNAADNYDYIRFTFGDIHGISRSKVVPRRHFSSAFRDGVTVFAGAVGFGTRSELVQQNEVVDVNFGNVTVKPVLGTLHQLPWAADEQRSEVSYYKHRVGEILCETFWTPPYRDGTHQAACPRYIAENQLDRLAKHGYQLLSGFEAEFMVCDQQCRPLFEGCDIFSNLIMSEYETFAYTMDQRLLTAGVDIYTFQTGYADGQFQFVLAPKRGIETADQMFVFKEAVKEICASRDWNATFMSKPFQNTAGNGLHFSHSVWSVSDPGTNVLHDPTQPSGLSEFGRHWIAGLLKHGRALTALCCPTVNCYRRLHSIANLGDPDWYSDDDKSKKELSHRTAFAPFQVDWGFDNRSAMVRAKTSKNPSSTFFENRLPGGSANPYLVLAATVAAGLDGVVNRLPCPPAVSKKSPGKEGSAADSDLTPLPADLPEALDALENDAVLVEALGEEFVRWFVSVKREAEIKEIDRFGHGSRLSEEHKLYFKLL